MTKKYKPEPGNEAAINEGELPVVIKLSLSPELYAEYEEMAEKQGLTPSELMTNRLQRCKLHSSIRSLYFSQSQLSQLEQLVQKRPIETAEQALAILTSLFAVRIGDFPPIPISAQQAKRIHLSAYGGQSAEQRLTYIIQGAIAKITGV